MANGVPPYFCLFAAAFESILTNVNFTAELDSASHVPTILTRLEQLTIGVDLLHSMPVMYSTNEPVRLINKQPASINTNPGTRISDDFKPQLFDGTIAGIAVTHRYL